MRSPVLRVERHQAFGKQVRARTMAAVPVVGRRAERQVDVAELFVGRHVRPHVGVAGVGARIVAPRLVAELALLRNRMQRPQLLAGAHVEAADVAARPFLVRRHVVNARAHDHHVAADDRRRGHRVVGAAHGVGQAGHQVDPAALAERRVERAGLRVHRNQVRVARAQQQALRPCPCQSRPVRDAAMHEPEVAGPARPPVGRVEHPDRGAGRRVDGGNLPERRHGVEHALHHQRRVVVHPRPRHRVGRRPRRCRATSSARRSSACRRCPC